MYRCNTQYKELTGFGFTKSMSLFRSARNAPQYVQDGILCAGRVTGNVCTSASTNIRKNKCYYTTRSK